MNIHESAENYLECIFMLESEHGFARSVDIAEKLGVSKPSVSVAMKLLRENGYINMERGSTITLTPAGEAVARRMYQRHRLLAEILIEWGVEPAVAYDDACKMEHDLSDQSFTAICAKAGRTPAKLD